MNILLYIYYIMVSMQSVYERYYTKLYCTAFKQYNLIYRLIINWQFVYLYYIIHVLVQYDVLYEFPTYKTGFHDRTSATVDRYQ